MHLPPPWCRSMGQVDFWVCSEGRPKARKYKKHRIAASVRLSWRLHARRFVLQIGHIASIGKA